MKQVEVFADLKFEKGNEHLSVSANGQVITFEFSDKKMIADIKQSSFKNLSLYNAALQLHKIAKKQGLEVVFQTRKKKIISLGNTSYYALKLILLKIARAFN